VQSMYGIGGRVLFLEINKLQPPPSLVSDLLFARNAHAEGQD
jgi:hypothetical protein